jgi:hypothetical protein
VQVEYHSFWMGAPGNEPSDTCLECGGHEVELLNRLSEYLLGEIEELEEGRT